jgi:hypothetical protein
MIFAFSLGESVVNHFASLCVEGKVSAFVLVCAVEWGSVLLCLAARAESNSCVDISTHSHIRRLQSTYLIAILKLYFYTTIIEVSNRTQATSHPAKTYLNALLPPRKHGGAVNRLCKSAAGKSDDGKSRSQK